LVAGVEAGEHSQLDTWQLEVLKFAFL